MSTGKNGARNQRPAGVRRRVVSGSAGVPPAVFRVSRDTPGRREKFFHKLTSAGCDAGCVAQQAGRPRYPRHAVRDLITPHFPNCSQS